MIVPPRSFSVIAKDTALLVQRYGPIPGGFLQVSSLPTFLFNNAGDAVVVFDNRDVQMDSVKYSPASGGNGGTSLERLDMLDASTDSSNWTSSTDTMRATPGRENSVAILDSDLCALKRDALVAPPGITVTMSLTVKNTGRTPAENFDVAFFDDRDRDSAAVPAELIARIHVAQSLARGETQRVEYIIDGRNIYLFVPNGYGKAKLNNNLFENKLKVSGTTRNLKTIKALFELTELH